MSYQKKVGKKKDYFRTLWACTIVYLLLISSIFAISTSVMANNPPHVQITQPSPGEVLSGNVTIWVRAWDADGNSQIEEVWIKINNEASLRNATNNHTDGDGQWWYYVWDTTEVSDGWHHITAITFDGIDDGSHMIEIQVDNTANNPPNTEIMEPADGETVNGTVHIWIRAWDADGKEDVEAMFVKIGDGSWHEATFIEYEGDYSWWVYEWDTTLVANGWYIIRAKAWDGENHSAEDLIEVLVDNPPENSPPGIEITHPPGGATLKGNVTIWMVAWDPDGNDQIQEVWVRIDGGALLNATYNHTDSEGQWWYYEWDTTTVEDGWHHIKAITFDGIDDAHDIIEVFVDNIVDNNPPGIEIVEPADGETVSGTIVIWMVAWDADGNDQIQDVWVRIDGGVLLNATYNHTNGEGQWWYFEWDTTSVEDGWHSIKASVFDGIDDGHDIIEVFVDNVEENHPPHIEIMQPENGKIVSGVIEIWLRAWDPDGKEDVEKVFVKIDSGSWHEATFVEYEGDYSWWVIEWDTTEVENGEHHIYAKAWDGEDHSGMYVIHVIVENEENHPPGIEIVEPEDGETVSGVVEIIMVAWDPDGNDDIQQVWVKIDSGIWHEATFLKINGDGSWWVYEWDTTIVGDGWHHIYAKTTDGELWADDHIEVYVNNEIDNHPPSIEIMHPEHGDTVSGVIEIWMVAWDADGLDDIENVWVKIDGGSPQEATFDHIDGDGSWWVFEWDTTKVDDGWHSITAIVYDGIDDGHDVIEVFVENDPANSPPHVEIMEPANGETVSGVIEIWLRAWDPDGKEDVEKVFVKIDSGSWHEATFVEYEGDYSWWIIEWDTTKVDDGEHHIFAKAWDGEEHSEEDVIYVIVDNEEENHLPHAEITEPENGETVSGVIEIWIRAWDLDGKEDVEKVFIKIDDGAWHEATFVEYEGDYSWWVFEWDTTKVENGEHHIHARAYDGVEHSEIDSIWVLVNNGEENHAPGIEIVEPTDGATVSGVIEILMVAWDPDGNDQIQNVWVKIDSGAWHEATFLEIDGEGSWWVFEWDTTSVEDGWHHIYAKTTDGHLWADDHIEVLVDNEEDNHAPVIDIIEPEHGATVSGTVVIWMVAWDTDGLDDIEDVWVRIDGGDLLNATYNHTDSEGQWWFYEWDTTTVEDGWHSVKAVVFDGIDDGHDIIEVLVDNTEENSPPHVEIVEPEHGDTVSGVVEILLKAWDADGKEDVEMVFVRIDGGSWEEATFIEYEGDYSHWVFEWDTTSVEDGEHHIYAKASDGETHSEEEVIMVMVDNIEGEDPLLSGILPLLILAALGGGLALFLAGTEVGIMAFMGLIFLPLYTKLSKKDVLDHFVRGQIFGYIKVNPGDNYTTIKKNLDLNNGTLTYHLNVLEKEGLIKSWTNGSHKYFYPLGVKIPGNGIKNPSIYDAILRSIRDSPGITVSDIASVNGISKQLANYHIRKMAAEGTIELERKSFSKVCYPKSTG